MKWKTAQLVVGREDRAAVLVSDRRLILVVADGAGGSGNGAGAAEFVLRFVADRIDDFDVVDLLRSCDLALTNGGESTAVVAIVDDSGVLGASVGDSAAWLVKSTGFLDLTERQVHKPLLGSGGAIPIPFGAPLDGTLVLGSDGLFKYGERARLLEIVRNAGLDEIPKRLIDSVRLRSGALQDDATAVVCQLAP